MTSEKGGGHLGHHSVWKYRLCRIIGRGRTGTVYLARHEGLGEYRAIKEVPKSDAGLRSFCGRLGLCGLFTTHPSLSYTI